VTSCQIAKCTGLKPHIQLGVNLLKQTSVTGMSMLKVQAMTNMIGMSHYAHGLAKFIHILIHCQTSYFVLTKMISIYKMK
jgi:hypothetical protein